MSDSTQPYTLDELATRIHPPRFDAYPTREAYELGWHIWRKIRWDNLLNPDEADARLQAIADILDVPYP